MAQKQNISADELLEELDLAIADMDTASAQQRAQGVLEQLPGIRAVRLVESGAWISYQPRGIAPGEIVNALRQSGFRASVFQSSETGKTGEVSF